MGLLEVNHLSVEYRRGKQVIPALRDVTFTLNEGETLAIVGESGSGKSTIALSLMGLIMPYEGSVTGGEILLDGTNLCTATAEQWRHVRGAVLSIVMQDPFTSLNPVLTIGEQIEEMIRVPSADRESLRGRVIASLRAVLFDDPQRMMRSYPHQLSGGQRQRAAIAMAIINRPRILIADEPTTALDVTTQKEVLDLLEKLRGELALTMIFITHNLALAAERAARVIIMKNGSIVETGPTHDVFRAPTADYTRQLVNAVPRLRTAAGHRDML